MASSFPSELSPVPGLRLGRSTASPYDVMLLTSRGHGALQSSSDITSTWASAPPPRHIPSKWQNMSVYFGHGTMTCPSSVHLCPPSTQHLFILYHLWGSLLHRAMGLSTPHSLTTMEQGILMVGETALTKSTRIDMASHIRRSWQT